MEILAKMVEKCARCGARGDLVRIYDAIYDGEMGYLCERCSIIENVPIIKKPTSSQLKDTEKRLGVYDRMKAMTGQPSPVKSDIFSPKERLEELKKNPNLEYPEEERLNLIEHFDWEIMKARRRKGLSHRQLAETLSESEIAIQMLEKGKIPGNALSLIIKLEQFFQIKLRNISYYEEINRKKRKEPVLLDAEGRTLNRIPEPEIVCNIETKKDSETPLLNGMNVVECKVERSGQNYKEKEESRVWGLKPLTKYLEFRKKEKERENESAIKKIEEEKKEEIPKEGLDEDSGSFDINRANLNKVTIADLRRLNKKRLEVTKEEKVEEQRKIEDREKLIEARKEELRLKKEKESKDIDSVLGGSELLGK